MQAPARWIAVLAVMAGCEGPDIGQSRQPLIMMNEAMMNQIMMNGLTGTFESLQALVSNPLDTDTFDPVFGALPIQLHDPDAQVFMEYLVSCALGPDDTIEWTDPFDDVAYEWTGAFGLCPAWADAPPSQACLEVVTGCLLARENALGDSVMFSPRGRHLPLFLGKATAIPLAKQVAAKPTDIEGDLVASFAGCPVSSSGPARDCGWSAARSLLGTCSPGKTATLACTDGSSPVSVRICEGTGACNHGDERRLAEIADACRPGRTTFSFTCGDDDDAFAVMLGGTSSGTTPKAGFTAIAGGVFPATELALYQYDEGAFYGNLFNPGRRHPGVTIEVDPLTGSVDTLIDSSVAPGAVVYGDAYSCGAPEWTHHDAYFHHRLCAIVSDDDGNQRDLCLSQNVGRCVTAGPWPDLCGSTDALPVIGDGDYGSCADANDAVRAFPMTVYLHDPCDMVPHRPDLCERGVQ